jgi:hypothetical protein
MKNLSQLSRAVFDTTRCVDLAAFSGVASTGLLSINIYRVTVDEFRDPLVGTSDLQLAKLRYSPHQLTLRRNSQFIR